LVDGVLLVRPDGFVNVRTGAVERVPLPVGRGRSTTVVPPLTGDRVSADP
jgi:hypothetical protein